MKRAPVFPFQHNAIQCNGSPAGEDSSSDMTSESLFVTSDMGYSQALHSCSTSKGTVARGLKTACVPEKKKAACPHEPSKRSKASGRGAPESGLAKPAKKPCSGNVAPLPMDKLLVLHKVAVDMLECWSHTQETPNHRIGKPVGSSTKSPVIGLVHEMEIVYSTAAAQCRQPARRRSRAELHGPCDHCGVQESPQWRKGPKCKPILCNACGTRFLRTRSLGRQSIRNGNKPAACPGEADETTGQVENSNAPVTKSDGGRTSPQGAIPDCRRQAEEAVASDLATSPGVQITVGPEDVPSGYDPAEARTAVGDMQSAASSDVGLSHQSPGLVAEDLHDIESGQLFFMRCRQALASSPEGSENEDASMPVQCSGASPQQPCGKNLTPLLALLGNTRGQNHPTQVHALFQSHARARSGGL